MFDAWLFDCLCSVWFGFVALQSTNVGLLLVICLWFYCVLLDVVNSVGYSYLVVYLIQLIFSCLGWFLICCVRCVCDLGWLVV